MSDGKAKHRDVLVILTMISSLSHTSPIYSQLNPLELMNFLVDPDDITANKDYKHVFKCLQNVLLQNKGIKIQGFCITPAILHLHLELNGLSSHQLRFLLDSNDKQDVILAYSLLKEIWSLPPPPTSSNPAFFQVWEALNLYGHFAYHLMMPYICHDLSLQEQLIHLNTVTHLTLHLYCDNSAQTHFLLTQLIVNIIIMVKNSFFCIEKLKVNNSTGQFCLILLGTDHLKTFFGLMLMLICYNSEVVPLASLKLQPSLPNTLNGIRGLTVLFNLPVIF